MSDFPQGPPSGPPSGPPPGGPPFGGPPAGGPPPGGPSFGPPGGGGGGGGELGSNMGSLDDGMRLLKRAQTLVPMYAKRNKSSLMVLAAISVLILVIDFMGIGLGVVLGLAEMYEFQLTWSVTWPSIIGFGGTLAYFLVAMLMRAGRRNMFEGEGTVASLKDAVTSSIPGLVGAIVGMLALGLGTLATACCVVPGVLAYAVLCWAPYLLAARGEEIGDGFSQSIELGQKYWSAGLALFLSTLVFLGGVYTLVGVLFGSFVGGFVGGIAMGAVADPTGMFIIAGLFACMASIFKWLCYFVAIAGVYSVTGGVMTAMEEDRYGEVVA